MSTTGIDSIFENHNAVGWKLITWLTAFAAGSILTGSAVLAADDHVLLAAEDIEWSAGPASIPEGAEAVVLYGNPGEEGVFSLRLKLPDGYQIAPHIHSQPEIVTVLSGTFSIGMGENADPENAEALGPGGFFAFPPGMAHFAFTEGETVIQLNSTGPWTLEYVDPADDPRQ